MKPLILTLLLTLAAPPKVAVHLSPFGYITQSRPTIHIKVTIAKHTDNRLAQLELVSEDYYSESEWGLEGEEAPNHFDVERRNLPVGHYQAFLTVYQANGKILTAKSEEAEVLNY